ncbi:MAG: macro domain-containing protein [Gammaproteobacteria bacterium]|nr:macro domain-containing protein [Gammaproteobacteria bacterium]
MNIIDGDLIQLAEQGLFDVIVHGCNCFCTMQSGIARQIKDNYPQAYQADLKTTKGDSAKLGTYSFSEAEIGNFVIVNAYTQFRYGRLKRYADYDAIQRVFSAIKRDFSGKRIGYPLIGAGLAGGDWTIISEIIDTELMREDHTLVKYIG